MRSAAARHANVMSSTFASVLLRTAAGLMSSSSLQARGIIRDAVGANDDDVVLFAGSGCTGAIQKLVHLLGLHRTQGETSSTLGADSQRSLECPFPKCGRRFADAGALKLHARTHPDGDRTALLPPVISTHPVSGNAGASVESPSRPAIVFVGPMEHHSNLLVWRESACTVVQVPADPASGGTDLSQLEVLLAANCSPNLLCLGSFSAASNLTGVREKVDAVTKLLHAHGALALWDFAAAAPHTAVDMNPAADSSGARLALAKDAVFLSPHKFPGGPGTPGLLVMKKRLIRNSVPHVPGGGTVFYVNAEHHRYLENLEEREEGGTPNILGCIRAGLVFQLQESVGITTIQQREHAILHQILHTLDRNDQIRLLGSAERQLNSMLPIITFLVEYRRTGRYLHHNFVTTLLSDLFGIQARGGCLCAGPYAHKLLGISDEVALKLEELLLHKSEIIRPGVVRVSLAYYWNPAYTQFVADAIDFVCREGWKFLTDYMFFPDTGEWRHRSIGLKAPFRRWLGSVDWSKGAAECDLEPMPDDASTVAKLFETARTAAAVALEKATHRGRKIVDERLVLDRQIEALGLLWFMLPSEIQHEKETQSVHQIASSQQGLVGSLNLFPNFKPTNDAGATAAAVEDVLHKNDTKKSAEPEVSGLVPKMNVASVVDVTVPLSVNKSGDTSVGSTNVLANQESKAIICTSGVCELGPFWKASCMDDSLDDAPVPATTDNDISDVQECILQLDCDSDSDCDPEDDHVKSAVVQNAELNLDRRPNRILWPVVPKHIMSKTGKAIVHYNMIREGDRVLLGLSGGKDSLCLLHVLHEWQRRSPVRFDLACVTMDPQFPGFDPSPLIPYMKRLGIPYYFESQPLLEAATAAQPRSICAWCSRMKRGILYTTARREGYNVLALAQHLDDLAESLVMNAFYSGLLRTMKACYINRAEDVRVIRPFIHVREQATREFSRHAELPIVDENCPACFEGPKERYRIKTLLAQQEHQNPPLMSNLQRAMKPLVEDEPYACKYCGKHFRFKTTYDEHIARCKVAKAKE